MPNNTQILHHDALDISPLKLSLVIPVYNEAESINLFINKVIQIFTLEPSIIIEFVFINDGSTDSTLEVLLHEKYNNLQLKVVDLSRNFGKEAALTAGLHVATGDVIVPIDVDLQDPPELIFEMISKWHEGYEVVLACRTDRNSDTQIKKYTANLFYKIHNKISDLSLPPNVGDFRLMDRCVVEAIKSMPESNRFMKGIFAWVGFRTTTINYTRLKRCAGTSKFSGWKLWNFALEGITSFSTKPLRIWTYLGTSISLLSFLYALFIISKTLFLGVELPGYASIMVMVTFLGGLQLIGIGILGEYLGRTYIESKRRPLFLIRHIYETKE